VSITGLRLDQTVTMEQMPMSDREHSGGCLCGAVRFRVSADPLWVAYCHCESCRRHTASVVATFAGFAETAVSFTGEAPSVFQSSPDVWRSFCGRCGSPISYRARRFPGEVHFYIGTLDKPERYLPQAHVHHGEHVAWFDTKDDLPRFERTATD
jgi:hypothetical protein